MVGGVLILIDLYQIFQANRLNGSLLLGQSDSTNMSAVYITVYGVLGFCQSITYVTGKYMVYKWKVHMCK